MSDSKVLFYAADGRLLPEFRRWIWRHPHKVAWQAAMWLIWKRSLPRSWRTLLWINPVPLRGKKLRALQDYLERTGGA